MAKKAAGPKESALRNMREGKGTGDGDEIASLFQSVEDAKRAAVDKLRAKRDELDERRRQLTAEIDGQIEEVEGYIAKLTGSPTGRAASRDGGGKRNAEQLRAEAGRLVSYLEKNPGASGTDLKAVADYGQNLKDFLQKYGGREVKVEGQRRAARYTLA